MSSATPRSRAAAGLPPITAAKITGAAVRLTARKGLDGWTIRELAAALNVYPAVIYHHVGDREAVLHAVTERVVAKMPCPPADLPWRDWFTTLLVAGRTVLRQHPGAARRLLVSGPTVPSALRIIDRGVTVLDRAGFGAEAVAVYSFLVGSGFLHVHLEDERTGRTPERLAARKVFAAFLDRSDTPGLAAMAEYAASTRPEDLREFDDTAYDYVVQRCLDGAQKRLDAITG